MGIRENFSRWGNNIRERFSSRSGQNSPPQNSYPPYTQAQQNNPSFFQRARDNSARAASGVGNVGKTVLVGAAGFGAGVIASGARGIIPSTAFDALFFFGLFANFVDYFLYGFSVNLITLSIDVMIFLWILVSIMRIDIKKVFLSLVLIFLIFFSDTFSFLSGGITQQLVYILGIIGLSIYFFKFEDSDAGILFIFFSLEVFAPKLAIVFPIIKPFFSLFLANKMVFPLWSIFAMIKGSKESTSTFITKAMFFYLVLLIFYVATNSSQIMNWEANANQIISPEQKLTAQENLKQAWERFKTFVTFPFKAFPAYQECKMQLEPNCTKWYILTKVNDTDPYTSPTGKEIPIIPTQVKLTLDPDGNAYTANMVQNIGLPIEIKIIRGTDEFSITDGQITCLFMNGTNEIYTGSIDGGAGELDFLSNEKEGNHIFSKFCKSSNALGPGSYRLNVTFTFPQKAKSYIKLYFVRSNLPDILGQKGKFPHYGEVIPAYMNRGLYEVDIQSKMAVPIGISDGGGLPEEGRVPVPIKFLFINKGEGAMNEVTGFNVQVPAGIMEKPFEINPVDLTVRIRENQKQNIIPTQDYPVIVTMGQMFTESNNPEELRMDVEMGYRYSLTRVARFKIAPTGG